jgi:hypothetical protein
MTCQMPPSCRSWWRVFAQFIAWPAVVFHITLPPAASVFVSILCRRCICGQGGSGLGAVPEWDTPPWGRPGCGAPVCSEACGPGVPHAQWVRGLMADAQAVQERPGHTQHMSLDQSNFMDWCLSDILPTTHWLPVLLASVAVIPT